MGTESQTLRDLFASVITGSTINTTYSTATDLLRSVVDTSGDNPALRVYGSGTSGSGSSGSSGTNGAAGSSGTNGSSVSYTLREISAEYTGVTNDYIRCSGDTYSIYLPEAIGSLGTILIKNASTGIISVVGSIDNLTTKTLNSYDALLLMDSVAGNWNIV